MDRTKIGLIRVLTTDNPELLASHGRLISGRFPNLEVVSRCIADQPTGVHDAATEAAAKPKVVSLAQAMAAEGYAAVIISCVADPGLERAREVAGVPVIGAGRAAALVCLAMGGTVGALGISDYVPAAMAGVLGPALVATARPEGVQTTLDLLRPQGKQAAIEAAAGLRDRGVDVIALACTGMSTIGIAGTIRREIGLRVVDPVTAAGLFTSYLIH